MPSSSFSFASRRRLKFRVFCLLIIVGCVCIQLVSQFSHLLDHRPKYSVILFSSQPTTTDQPTYGNLTIATSRQNNDFTPVPGSATAERGSTTMPVTTKANKTKAVILHPSIPNPHKRFHEVLRKKKDDDLREREEDPVFNIDKTKHFISTNYNPNSTHRPSSSIKWKDERNEDQLQEAGQSINPSHNGMNNVNLLLSRQKSNSNAKRRYGQSPFIQGYKTSGGKLPLDTAEYLMDEKMWKDVDNGTCVSTTKALSGHDNNNDSAAVGGDGGGGRDVNEEEWQHRAPYAILLGAMKSGTHAVTASLWEHPAIARNGHWELHFFDSDRAIRSERGIDRQRTLRNYAEAFEKSLTQSNFSKASIPKSDGSSESLEYYAIESSPRYLLNSDRLPDMILCTVPWAKLIAILRNPIDRAASQYRYLDEVRRKYNNAMVDWDTWINDDLRLLNEAGVLDASTQEEEFEAWKMYQRRPNSHMIVGRGLYVIQLEQWFTAMDRVGKSRDEFFVLQSEKFRGDRQGEYNRLLEFLKFSPHQLVNIKDEHTTATHDQSIPIPEHIRSRLQDLYRPYNERLYRLLGWENCWG